MAAVALQRELDAYADAIDAYNRQARHYKAGVAKHNASVDAYKAAFIKDKSGEIARFEPTKSGYMGLDDARGIGIKKADANANYVVVNFGNNMGVGLQYKDKAAPKPGEFNMAQPVSPGPAPSATAAQLKKLDQPSLTDVERNSGLINSAFNF